MTSRGPFRPKTFYDSKDAHRHLTKTACFLCMKRSWKCGREGGASVLSYNESWVYYELRKVLLF